MSDTKVKASNTIEAPATLEIYVQKYGISGALSLLQQKVWADRTPKHYREFFKKCLELLTFTSDHPKLIAAAKAHEKNHALAPGL